MKAVNLIPVEDRRGGAGGAGRSGGAVYVLLGALAVAVIAIAGYVLTTNTIGERKSELARTQNQATAAQAQADALRPYRQFAQLRQTRVLTVAALAASRFDWERAMSDLARVIPGNVWLTSFKGTVSPGVQFGGTGSGGGGAGDTASLRAALAVPAVELVGCTTSQAEVARVLTRLRLIEGVQRVSLASSAKSDSQVSGAPASAADSAGSGGNSGDCRHGSGKFPQFQVVVFFQPLPGTGATGATGATSSIASVNRSAPAAPTQARSVASGSAGGTP